MGYLSDKYRECGMNSSPKKETTFSNMSYIEQVLAYYTWCVRYRWLVPFLRGGGGAYMYPTQNVQHPYIQKYALYVRGHSYTFISIVCLQKKNLNVFILLLFFFVVR